VRVSTDFSRRPDLAGRGPAPKAEKIRRHKPKEASEVLALVPKPVVPEPPERFSEPTKAWWVAFWASDVARSVRPELHLPALIRLGDLYDKREKTSQAIDGLEDPVSEGSTKQLVAHPLYKILGQLDAEIRQLEDRFGGNPRALVSLGLQFNQARRELGELWNKADRPKKGGLKVIDPSSGGLS
jgi:hypothetical protein